MTKKEKTIVFTVGALTLIFCLNMMWDTISYAYSNRLEVNPEVIIKNDKIIIEPEVTKEKGSKVNDEYNDINAIWELTESEELKKARELYLEEARIREAETAETEEYNSVIYYSRIQHHNEKHNGTSAPSGLTIEELDKFLEGSPLQGYGYEFLKAEYQYGVSAGFLAAIAKQESNLGRSNIAIKKNNLFGYSAYDYDPYGTASKYSSFSKCIDIVAERIYTNYLSPDGKYYRGGRIHDIGPIWAQSTGWSDAVYSILQKINKIEY